MSIKSLNTIFIEWQINMENIEKIEQKTQMFSLSSWKNIYKMNLFINKLNLLRTKTV